MKKILITGINGFVAKHFLNLLESKQKRISVLGLDILEKEEKHVYQFVELRTLVVDLLDLHAVENILFQFQPDYVLHLASYSSVAYSWKNPMSSFRNNTNIFLNLVETLRNNSMNPRILSIGSSEEYGNINIDHLPLIETSLLDPVSPYAVARVSQEMLSKIYATSYGMNIVMTRSFNHIGPGQSELFVVSSFVKRILDQLADNGDSKVVLHTGDLSIIRDFLDVRDVVSAYLMLLEKGERGEVYNVCSGIGRSLRQIIEIIEQQLNIEIELFTESSLIRPNDNKVIIGSNEKLKSLGWSQRYPIEQCISDVIQYWRS